MGQEAIPLSQAVSLVYAIDICERHVFTAITICKVFHKLVAPHSDLSFQSQVSLEMCRDGAFYYELLDIMDSYPVLVRIL